MSWPHIILTLSVTRRPSMTLHWPQSHNTERTKSTKQRIRERDLHISAPRRPWHNWVLPGGPGFPDADIPKLLRTNQSPETRSRDLTRPIRGQDKGLLTNDIRGWEWQECDKQTVMMTLVSIDLLSPDTGLHTPAHTSHCVPIVWCEGLIRSRTDLILNRISKLAPEFWDPIVPSLVWWYNPWYLILWH